MKFKVTGLLLIIAGAVVASTLPIPSNIIGVPIAAIGAILVIVFGGQRRNP